MLCNNYFYKSFVYWDCVFGLRLGTWDTFATTEEQFKKIFTILGNHKSSDLLVVLQCSQQQRFIIESMYRESLNAEDKFPWWPFQELKYFTYCRGNTFDLGGPRYIF